MTRNNCLLRLLAKAAKGKRLSDPEPGHLYLS
jgi:hypothetical protein